jgi:hypothetical protein
MLVSPLSTVTLTDAGIRQCYNTLVENQNTSMLQYLVENQHPSMLQYLVEKPAYVCWIRRSTATLTYAGSALSTVTLTYAGSPLSSVTLTDDGLGEVLQH